MPTPKTEVEQPAALNDGLTSGLLEAARRALERSRRFDAAAEELLGDSAFALSRMAKRASRRCALGARVEKLAELLKQPAGESAHPRDWLTYELHALTAALARLDAADSLILQEVLLTDVGVGD